MDQCPEVLDDGVTPLSASTVSSEVRRMAAELLPALYDQLKRIAHHARVWVAYAIGVAHPVSVELETLDRAAADPVKVADAVAELFDLRPAAIIDELELR